MRCDVLERLKKLRHLIRGCADSLEYETGKLLSDDPDELYDIRHSSINAINQI